MWHIVGEVGREGGSKGDALCSSGGIVCLLVALLQQQGSFVVHCVHLTELFVVGFVGVCWGVWGCAEPILCGAALPACMLV